MEITRSVFHLQIEMVSSRENITCCKLQARVYSKITKVCVNAVEDCLPSEQVVNKPKRNHCPQSLTASYVRPVQDFDKQGKELGFQDGLISIISQKIIVLEIFGHWGFQRFVFLILMIVASSSMESISETCRKLKSFADMTLVASDGIEFHVHKVFLARSSIFFREMFLSAGSTSHLSESSRLQLSEFQGCDLREFLNCIYSPAGIPIPISLDNVKMLTEAARKYQMPALMTASDMFCCQEVNLVGGGQVLDWLSFAYEYELQDFAKKCEQAVKMFSLDQLIGHFKTAEEIDALPKKVATQLLVGRTKIDGSWSLMEGGGAQVT